MSLVSGPISVSMARAVADAVADRAGQFRETHGKVLRLSNDLAVPQRERATPTLPPYIDIGDIVRPGEVSCELVRHSIEMERCVQIVPPKDF